MLKKPVYIDESTTEYKINWASIFWMKNAASSMRLALYFSEFKCFGIHQMFILIQAIARYSARHRNWTGIWKNWKEWTDDWINSYELTAEWHHINLHITIDIGLDSRYGEQGLQMLERLVYWTKRLKVFFSGSILTRHRFFSPEELLNLEFAFCLILKLFISLKRSN